MSEQARSLRDQAFLALLLLVGAGALGSGLFQVLVEANSGPVAIFDTVLGIAVLLVTWLFLAPLAAPALFGDPTGGGPLIRPYLPLPIGASAGTGPGGRSSGAGRGRGSRPSPLTRDAREPEPIIPRWADPLVHRNAAPGGSPPLVAARLTPPPAEPPMDEPSEDPGDEDDTPTEHPVGTPEEPGETSVPAEDPGDMVRELDLISAEIENPPRKRPTLSRDPPPFGAAGAA